MKTNILTTAIALSDQDLLARIGALAATERETTAELVAHLGALELRRSLYLAQGYGSLYRYCIGALRLSEDAACARIQAARACTAFPVILDLLYAGTVTLTAVRLLEPHLTAENHAAVLARAANRSREDIEALVTELSPKPDVVSSVRKLPVRKEMESAAPSLPFAPGTDQEVPRQDSTNVADPSASPSQQPSVPTDRTTTSPNPSRPGPAPLAARARPIVRASSPHRYRVQFTIGQETYDKLRWVQAMLRREIPGGDPAVIFDRALDRLREDIEKTKLGKTKSPRRIGDKAVRSSPAAAAPGAYEIRIRLGTDRATKNGDDMIRRREEPSRHIPNAVKRAVWCRTAVNARSYQPTVGDVANGPSWSSTTSSRMHWMALPQPGTSRYAAGAITNTKPTWCSDRGPTG